MNQNWNELFNNLQEPISPRQICNMLDNIRRNLHDNPNKINDIIHSPDNIKAIGKVFDKARETLHKFDHTGLSESITATASISKITNGLQWINNNAHTAFETEWMQNATLQLDTFNAQELGNIILALSCLKHPGDAFEKAFIKVATLQLGEFNAHDLAHSIWVVHHFKYSNDFDTESIQNTTLQLDTFNAHDLAHSMYALLRLKHYNTSFEAIWAQTAINKLGEFNAQELTMSIHALSILEYHDEDFKKAWAQAATNKLGEFNAQELANSIWAIALLNYHDATFEDKWIHAATDKLGEFNDQELSNVILALFNLGRNDPIFNKSLTIAMQSFYDVFAPENCQDICTLKHAVCELYRESQTLSNWEHINLTSCETKASIDTHDYKSDDNNDDMLKQLDVNLLGSN